MGGLVLARSESLFDGRLDNFDDDLRVTNQLFVRNSKHVQRGTFTCTIHSCATYARVKRPLIRLRHLLPQLKSAEREGLSIRADRISERGSCECRDPDTADHELAKC